MTEAEHSRVYEELTETIDELMYRTKLNQLKKAYLENKTRSTIDDEYNKVKQLIFKDTLILPEDKRNDTKETELLWKLLTIRKNIIKQQFMTYPILRSLHGNDGLVKAEKELIDLIRGKDDSSLEYNEVLDKFKLLSEESVSNDIRNRNLEMKMEFEANLQLFIETHNEIRELKFQRFLKEDEFNKLDGDLERIKTLKFKNNTLIEKNFLLNDFINNLIYSLNINWYNDEFLARILEKINEFNDYQFEDI